MNTIARSSSGTGSQVAPKAERKHQLYETPAEATLALLRDYPRLPRLIWEPMCGKGAIVRVLRDAGHDVVASDLIDYGAGFTSGVDFYDVLEAPPGVTMIITNPAFDGIAKFVEHGLKLVRHVIILARIGFLESDRRAELLDRRQVLKRVHIFTQRLPRMHRDGWTGKESTSNTAYGWFVFDAEHCGPPTLHRIDWKTKEAAGARSQRQRR